MVPRWRCSYAPSYVYLTPSTAPTVFPPLPVDGGGIHGMGVSILQVGRVLHVLLVYVRRKLLAHLPQGPQTPKEGSEKNPNRTDQLANHSINLYLTISRLRSELSCLHWGTCRSRHVPACSCWLSTANLRKASRARLCTPSPHSLLDGAQVSCRLAKPLLRSGVAFSSAAHAPRRRRVA